MRLDRTPRASGVHETAGRGGATIAVLRTLPPLVDETHRLTHTMQGISFLEERLRDISDMSEAVLERLVPEEEPARDAVGAASPAHAEDVERAEDLQPGRS